MSIASSIAADFGNEKRKEWLSKLEAAYEECDWLKVEKLIAEMRAFYFSE